MVIRIMIAVILLAILFAIALYIDYILGRKSHLKSVRRATPSSSESNMTIFADGPSLFTELFAELKQAKSHIHVLFYIVKDDGIGQDFLTILKEKASEGVEVRLLLDWAGSLPIILNKKLKKDLKSHGIELAFANSPTFPFLFYNVQARNHRKISVIDGKFGYIGGFNVGGEYINLDPKLSPWRDYHLKLSGEGAIDLQKVFLSDWKKAAKIDLLHDVSYFPHAEKGMIKHRIIPTDAAFLEEHYSQLIKDASQTIDIGTPYFIPGKKLLNNLLSAIGRGVKVTILIPYTSDHILVKEASYPYLRKLIQAGAEVYEYKYGFYHAKTMIVDNVAVIGTANFDKRSFFLNYEINCYIYDESFHAQLNEIYKKDVSKATLISLQDITGFRPIRKGKELAARSLSLFL
ncbi:cardiolipin synthase [Cytobacillus purgationiresistens]|uniref:Cardiolipin synthase n=1 Tax=Cytobacillus purgationiresistens TaxID=863449 RepID=A0ABU0AKH1_9BACI|nr:cardiolipin synthase [Cytobacillus purgationiresistens]MDQ0271754.1 cardiolipin synthase [Cytobacillus purgationiresistens]